MITIDTIKEISIIKRRLLALIRENESKTLSFEECELVKDEIRSLYTKYLKLYITYGNGVPSMNKEWNYDNNCYHYAFDLPTPDLFIEAYYRILDEDFSIEVGAISNLPYIDDDEYSLEILLKYLYSDLKELDINIYPSTINSPLEHDGFKVAIFYDDINKDYHFVRQNAEGIWSQKYGLNRTICFSESPLNFLNNPPFKEYGNHYYYEYVGTIEVVKPALKNNCHTI